MSNPYRAMCADMLEAFDGLPCETNYRGQSRPIVCIDEEPFDRARALLVQPEPSGYDEPARFAAWLRKHSSDCMELGRPDWAHMISRAAELLDRLASDNAGLEAAAEFFYLDNLSLLDGQND
jgi:hypothetical protein